MAIEIDCAEGSRRFMPRLPGLGDKVNMSSGDPARKSVDHAEKPEKLTNAVKGKVLDIAYLGNLSTYHVELPTGHMIKAQTANTRRIARRASPGKTRSGSAGLTQPACAGGLE